MFLNYIEKIGNFTYHKILALNEEVTSKACN